jgi:parvulin-like peptidyl-prolyl isomerase
MIDLRERALGRVQRGEMPKPANDSAERALEIETLDDMIQEELLIQKAADLKIEVTDADVSQMVDRQVRETRSKFTTESEYRTALAQSSLGTPDEYQVHARPVQAPLSVEKVVNKLKQDGKIVSIQVSDTEVGSEFNRSKEFLPPKPPMVTFKQIVMAVQPSPAAKEAARVRAESLLVRLKAGADFEQTARHESMDPLTKESGGDLGWAVAATTLPEFDRYGCSAVRSPLPWRRDNQLGLRDGARVHIVRAIACRRVRVRAPNPHRAGHRLQRHCARSASC